MSDETLRILKLLEAGKISSREADDLLSAVKDGADGDHDDHQGFEFQHHGRHHLNCGAKIMRDISKGMIMAEVMSRIPPIPKIPKIPKMPRLPAMPDFEDFASGRASAEETQTVTVPAEGVAAVSLSQPRSDITVTGADTGQIVITADLEVWADDQDEARERLKSLKLVTENDNGTLKIKLDGPPWTKKRRTRSDFSITMPSSLAVELGTASGDIELDGIAGGIKAGTASGDIIARNASGRCHLGTASGDLALEGGTGLEARLESVSGDIEVSSCTGRVALQTVSGDAEVEVDTGGVSAESVSGDLTITIDAAADLAVRSTSGDITIEVKKKLTGRNTISSISGDIELSLPDDSGATIEAATTSGDIDCDLELEDLRQRSRSLTGKLGNGEAAIVVTTTSGDISLS